MTKNEREQFKAEFITSDWKCWGDRAEFWQKSMIYPYRIWLEKVSCISAKVDKMSSKLDLRPLICGFF